MTRTERLSIRVTPEEKQEIQNKVKKENTTITALVLNSVENNVTVNLDTSDYRDLVIQFRRIGNNINGILKRIHYSNYITDTDLINIEKNQQLLKEVLNEERLKIIHTKDEFENLTPRKIREFLKKEKKRIPKYLIYDEISEQINIKLKDFIQLMEDEKWKNIYPHFIEAFIKNFHPTDYTYDELVSFSDDLGEVIYGINQKTILGKEKIIEKDFDNILNVLNKYRKEVDE